MSLACDIIFATKDAKFGFPEIKLGLFPCLGGTLISKTLGKNLASELMLTGKLVSAEYLEKKNIVNGIFLDYESCYREALKLAEKIS